MEGLTLRKKGKATCAVSTHLKEVASSKFGSKRSKDPMDSRQAPKSNQSAPARNAAEEGIKQPQAPTIEIEGVGGKDEASPKSTLPPPISTSTVIQSDDNAIKNQKLVEEFQYLLEKSQSLFAGLR